MKKASTLLADDFEGVAQRHYSLYVSKLFKIYQSSIKNKVNRDQSHDLWGRDDTDSNDKVHDPHNSAA